MELVEGEPAVPGWTVVSRWDLVERLLDAATREPGRPTVLAIDGRGASGKSTLADLIELEVDRVSIVHTDDIAWHEPYFRWGHLLRDGVLRPLHEGRAVDFRPPAWDARKRTGAVSVPRDARLVVVEGAGASQQAVAGLVDAAIWVQSDFSIAEERGIARDIANGDNGDPAATVAFWHEWMAEELAFFRDDRPWERENLIVAGTPPQRLLAGEFAIADGPLLP